MVKGSRLNEDDTLGIAIDTLRRVASSWSLEIVGIRNDKQMSGSPERCLFRTVVEDRQGKLFILEHIDHLAVPRKKTILRTLEYLHRSNLAGTHPYLRTTHDRSLFAVHRSGFWQLVPYLEGIPLPRPAYLKDSWRGRSLGDFLVEMRRVSDGLSEIVDKRPFAIGPFIYDLAVRLEVTAPQLLKLIQPALHYLEKGFMRAQEQLPCRFCHGDYHPVNIIWSEKEILSVIDWEFLGYKPELHDVANLIGCAGMEHPEHLSGALIDQFLSIVVEGLCCEEISWIFLPEYVLALRFAWLSEWLRKRDREMIELELAYIDLLTDQQEHLRRCWPHR